MPRASACFAACLRSSGDSFSRAHALRARAGTSAGTGPAQVAVAIKTAGGTLRDLRIAEVVAQDIHIAEDGELTYRTKLRVSFKYEAGQ